MRTTIRLFPCLFLFIHVHGCTRPQPTTTPGGNAKLEVDAALADAGITVSDQPTTPTKRLLVFRSAKQDHESTNYSYILLGPDGAKLDSNSFSIPGFKKDESGEWLLEHDDLPKASRIVIRYYKK